MADCRTLQEKIERLIQEGHLSQYVRKGNEKAQPAQRWLERRVETSRPKNPVMMLDARREGGREVDHYKEGTPGTKVASVVRIDKSRKRKAYNVLAVRRKADITPTPVITFSERDMRYEPPRQDEPMVISVVTTEYKVERVLIDQGSSANILYWSTCKKLGLQSADLEACVRKLYGFVDEQVTVKGVTKLDHVRRTNTRMHHPDAVHSHQCRRLL
ncbi:hypothetical protein CR513_30633, partial [Mucuna pruriens]